MQWITRAHLHLDRTASAWLIRRFVDPEAQIEFVSWDDAVDLADDHVFGISGARWSGHDSDGTCFDKILRAEELADDAALVLLGRSVAAGVRHALQLSRCEENEELYAVGRTLDMLGTGLGLLHADDREHLAAGSFTYDALYTYFQLPDLASLTLPNSQPERREFLQELILVDHHGGQPDHRPTPRMSS